MKIFIPDANVFGHDPNALLRFGDNEVVFVSVVLDEIDNMKNYLDEAGYNAREFGRQFDKITDLEGDIQKGIPLPEGGTLRVAIHHEVIDEVKKSFPERKNDNRILSVAYQIHQAELKKGSEGKQVVLITNDMDMKSKAKILKIPVERYRNDRFEGKLENLHKGYQEIQVPMIFIDELTNQNRKIPVSELKPYLNKEVYPQDFLILQSMVNSEMKVIGRLKPEKNGDLVLHKIEYNGNRIFGIKPKNLQQRMLFDLLTDPEIKAVFVPGSTGGGKTLLALAAAMKQTLEDDRYRKILASKPVVEMDGKGIGFLKGNIEEKMLPWMQSYYDNLEYIFDNKEMFTNSRTKTKNTKEEERSYPKKRQKLQKEEDKKDEKQEEKDLNEETRELMKKAHNRIRIQVMAFLRGRSIPKQYFIIDEAQNLTPHAIKTSITRLGEGSKLVICGDIEQIDTPRLDAYNNGLTFAIDRLKDDEEVGIIYLEETVRSDLAARAIKKLR